MWLLFVVPLENCKAEVFLSNPMAPNRGSRAWSLSKRAPPPGHYFLVSNFGRLSFSMSSPEPRFNSQYFTAVIMPAKELNKPCMECKDAEFELTVRKRQLCRYAISRQSATPPAHSF